MLTDVVVQAVRKAEDLALCKMKNLGKIREKSHRDFVTEVDEEIEKIIITHIRERLPNSKFYGEETGRQGEGKYLFVIDPIDATTNYIKGIPFFDVSISVYEENKNILGVIACPILGEIYIAERGKGAYLNGDRIHVSDVRDLSKAVVGYNRSSHPLEIIESSKLILSKILDNAATLRIFGTGGLDYCYLARGCLDVCITPLAEPFHSAGYIIMEEAGAKVTDYQGKPHDLESTTIVSANPILHSQVLKIVNE